MASGQDSTCGPSRRGHHHEAWEWLEATQHSRALSGKRAHSRTAVWKVLFHCELFLDLLIFSTSSFQVIHQCNRLSTRFSYKSLKWETLSVPQSLYLIWKITVILNKILDLFCHRFYKTDLYVLEDFHSSFLWLHLSIFLKATVANSEEGQSFTNSYSHHSLPVF